MDIWHGLQEIPDTLSGSVVTIGVFDGVHRGHQSLIAAAREQATQRGLPAVVMTFDPHPTAVIRPDSMPPLLGTLENRAELISAQGLEHMLALKFTRDLAALEPEEFFTTILRDKLRAQCVVVGENFRFGHKAAGNTETLIELGRAHGIEVIVQPLLEVDGIRCSSTNVRKFLAGGDVASAAVVLGRPFSVSAMVARGAGRGGAELGFPTANMYFPESAALPQDGVYAGWFLIDSEAPIDGDMERGVRYPAAISVGTNPTFGDARRSVETFVLDRHADLYGHDCTVEFIQHVRGMLKFESVAELLEAMERDIAQIREILA
ncbi:bifunctional riboflavin kinase/FAD synthetase [Corynebacterium sp. H128]|uniref:bifunctional riboflavin kinase/FAD synthetase n=1 Tax=Corynebacterium sp. H128 TaxID=3133427 RepID=UPI0030A30AAC